MKSSNEIDALPRFATPEAEISFLREKIGEKERELREKKLPFETGDVVKAEISRYKDTLSKQVLDDTYALAEHDIESIILNLSPELHDKKMEELLGIFREKGIKNTMSVLSGFKDPHLEDDFHRFLVQYIQHGYDKKDVNLGERQFRGIGMTLYEIALAEEVNP